METAQVKPVILNNEEIEKTLKQRLSTGWVVITGNIETITQLENTYFTPGTPANADFELLILSSRPRVQYLFLARKQRLKALNIVDLERTLELYCAGLDANGAEIQQTLAKDGEPERVTTYVKNLMERTRSSE